MFINQVLFLVAKKGLGISLIEPMNNEIDLSNGEQLRTKEKPYVE